jgi:hypothetical protein
MSPFLKHSSGFDPKTLAILEISFDATFKELQHNPYFDPESARTPPPLNLMPPRPSWMGPITTHYWLISAIYSNLILY